MHDVPQAGLTQPSVAGQLGRGVRPHCAGVARRPRFSWRLVIGKADTVHLLGDASRSDESNHTSSKSCPSIKKRYPGGKSRYSTTWGKYSCTCSMCSGAKKSGSDESSVPHQMYQPFVVVVGACRRPFIGSLPSDASAKPTFVCGAGASGVAWAHSQTV